MLDCIWSYSVRTTISFLTISYSTAPLSYNLARQPITNGINSGITSSILLNIGTALIVFVSCGKLKPAGYEERERLKWRGKCGSGKLAGLKCLNPMRYIARKSKRNDEGRV